MNQRPAEGGSYIRDPETGKLQRAGDVQPPQPPAEKPAADDPPRGHRRAKQNEA